MCVCVCVMKSEGEKKLVNGRERKSASERVSEQERDNISDLILIFIFSTRNVEKVFLVNVYKKERRRYFMDVIVNYNQYIIINIILFYY